MFMIKMEESSMAKTKAKFKRKKPLYCKRCGVQIKLHFQIQLTPKRVIDVCADCFDWSMGKTPAEIRKDYDERARRKV